jgi:hypothetical protein
LQPHHARAIVAIIITITIIIIITITSRPPPSFHTTVFTCSSGGNFDTAGRF